ncbi:MAG: dienelactone hydrolase family protein [Solirubrobacterales bacterium]|nr:dienelactone hydrolase family protein [Solirubrobacterales bacterium]
MVEVSTPDGIADAYLTGAGDGQAPGVLFLMDAFGLREQIEVMADRIAEQGYTVLAPNLFYRAGKAPVVPFPDLSDPDGRTSFFGKLRPLMEQLSPQAAAEDGTAYLNYLESVAAAPIAVVGYCLGGRIGWRIATGSPERVAMLAAFHPGGLATDAPDSPHNSADQIRAELYIGYADEDPSMNSEQIATLERALDDAGVIYRAELYKDARHGYTMADTPSYNEAAAERHFGELFSVLDRTLTRT